MSSRHRIRKATIQKIVKACMPALKKRASLAAPVQSFGCGVQGCVYKATGTRRIVKVTMGAEEAAASIWRKNLGTGAPAALPRVYRVAKLVQCVEEARLRGRGPRVAYVTVREDLPDVPRQWAPHRRLLADLVRSLEDTFRHHGRRHTKLSHTQVMRGWYADNARDLAKLIPFEEHIIESLAFLFTWLHDRRLVMFDVHLDNLGVRKKNHGWPAVVVRDIGMMYPSRHSRVPMKRRFGATYVNRNTATLGSIDAL
jgi:hypothetical protein